MIEDTTATISNQVIEVLGPPIVIPLISKIIKISDDPEEKQMTHLLS
jgi:hypothetical protein